MKRIRGHILYFLLFCAASYLLFYDVLRNNVLIYGRDTQSHDFIMYFYGWRAILQTGSIPLWMPHLFGGIPFIGSFAFCPFYPLQLSFAILHFPLVFSLQYFLSIFLAGCFFYYFVRAIGLSHFVAFFSGLMFLASAHLVTLCFAGHLQKLQAIIWIPLVFAFLYQAITRPAFPRYVLVAAVLSMQLLASHFQIFIYTVFAASLFFLWCLFVQPSNGRSTSDTLKHLGAFILAVFFACLLAGAQMLPGAEMARLSNRAAGLTYEQATYSSYPPEEVPEVLLPRFTGDSTPKGFNVYLGSWGERLVSDYAGAAVIILAIAAFFLSKRRERFFFLLLFFLALALACGKFSPIYKLAYSFLPFIRNFRSPATIMVFMTFSGVSLAALGLESLLHCERKPALAALRTLLILGIGFLTLAGILHYALLRLEDLAPQAGQFAAAIKRDYLSLRFLYTAARHTTFFAGAVSLSLALWLAARSVQSRPAILKTLASFAAALFVLCSFADIYTNDRAFIIPDPINKYYNYLFNNWGDRVLRKESKPIRTLEVGNELTNRMILSGVSSVHGYHPVAYKRYFDLIDHFGFYSATLGKLLYQRFLEAPRSTHVPPFFAPLASGQNETIFRRTDSLSYAYFPKHIEQSPDVLASLVQSAQSGSDPYEVSFVSNVAPLSAHLPRERDLRHANVSENIMPSGTYITDVTTYDNDAVRIRTDCSDDVYCIACDYAVPGWRAYADDEHEIPIYRANYFFRMIRAPRGVHTISFRYEPFSFRLGLFCSLIGISLAIVLLAATTRSKKPTH